MVPCRVCSHEMPEGSRFCPGCGSPRGVHPAAAAATRTLATPSTPAPGESRFAPGTLLAGRYEMLGLAGRGGMGEVY